MDICRQKDHKPWSRPSFCGLSRPSLSLESRTTIFPSKLRRSSTGSALTRSVTLFHLVDRVVCCDKRCTARARLSSPLTSSPTPRSVYGIFLLTIYFAGYCFVPHALIYRQLSIGLIWLCGYIQKWAKWRKLFARRQRSERDDTRAGVGQRSQTVFNLLLETVLPEAKTIRFKKNSFRPLHYLIRSKVK